MLMAASLMSLLFRKNSPVLLLGIDTGGVDVSRISDEDLLFRIAVSILTSECRSLDRRTSDPMLDLCSRQQNRSTLDRLTPRVLEMSSSSEVIFLSTLIYST